MLTAALGVVLLAAAAASSWPAARAALALAGEPSRAVAAALCAAWLAVVPAEAARVVDDLRVGLAIAALVASLTVLALRRVSTSATTTTTAIPTPPPWAWPAFAIVFALVAVCTFRGNFFDEAPHWAMILGIARGVVPPRIAYTPDTVFHYHWGFDAIASGLVDAGLNVENAEDVAVCASFALLLAVAYAFGARVTGGPRGATLVALGVPLASSPLAWPLYDFGPASIPSPYPARWSELLQTAQPPASVFFQHPQGFAMPLFLAALLVFSRNNTAARAITAVLVGFMSLANVAYFELLGAGLTVASVVSFARTKDRRALVADAASLAVALVVAIALGGILTHGPPFQRGTFFQDPALLLVLHHVVVFGAPLLALPFFARRYGPIGAALAAVAVVGFAVPNLVVLRDTWDIVKLDNIAMFAAGAGLFALLGDAVEHKRRAIAAVAVGVASSLVCVAWLATTAVRAPRELTFSEDIDEWRRAFSPLVPPYARVLVDHPAIAVGTGFLTPGFVLKSKVFDPYAHYGVDRVATEAAAQARARAVVDLAAADLDALRIDFVLATPNLVEGLSPAGKAALTDERRFEPLAGASSAVLLKVLRPNDQ